MHILTQNACAGLLKLTFGRYALQTHENRAPERLRPRFWQVFGRFWALLGALGRLLGASWASLDASWGLLGRLLGPLGLLFGIWGRFLEQFWNFWESFWEGFERVWTLKIIVFALLGLLLRTLCVSCCITFCYRNPRAASLRPAERHNTRGFLPPERVEFM